MLQFEVIDDPLFLKSSFRLQSKFACDYTEKDKESPYQDRLCALNNALFYCYGNGSLSSRLGERGSVSFLLSSLSFCLHPSLALF